MYGKLVKNNLVVAPLFIVIDKFKTWNAPKEEMLKQGWKPVKLTDPPEPTKADTYFIPEWKEEKEEILQIWIETPIKEG